MKEQSKKVLIISGSWDPILQATLRLFHRKNYIIYILEQYSSAQKFLAYDLKSQRIPVEFVRVDFASQLDLEKTVKSIYDKHKRIDVLINYASQLKGVNHETEKRQWQKVLDLSLTGLMNMIKAVHPFMMLANTGRIINSTSMLGFYGEIAQPEYHAVKNGIAALSKIWTNELSKYGITVNTVAPGYFLSDPPKPSRESKQLMEKIPSRRMGKAEDLANIYTFLASDESSYISGAIIPVDGGYSC